MSELSEEYRPLEYDAERLQKFLYRASYNLSSRYKLPKAADRSAEADALIGFFVEKPVDMQISDLQTELAIDFLTGEPIESLEEKYDELPGVEEGVTETALIVARLGARAAMEHLQPGYWSKNTRKPPRAQPSPLKHELTHASIDEFNDLDTFIIDMLTDKRISAKEAGALMLLFELRPSNASRATQLNERARIQRYLAATLQKMARQQPHRKEQIADRTLAQGLRYIELIMERPLSRPGESSPLTELVNDRLIAARLAATDSTKIMDGLVLKDAKKHIHGHIGYVLNKLY